MKTILEMRNVSYAYYTKREKVPILDDSSYTFEAEKLYAIIGTSGCGKTTTLSLLGALDEPQKGEIFFDGENLKKIGYCKYRNRDVGIVFQSYNLLEYLTVIQNVIAVMDISKEKIKNKKERAEKLLERVGILPEQFGREIRRISGGQQQRVAIARAIAINARVILADEPTGNLDKETADGIIKIFQELAHEDGRCVIVVTHSEEFAAHSDVIVKLENGKLNENRGHL